MPSAPRLINPKRSAHASIRGYLYQACLGARRWLELEEGQALLCEGDEDLDRLLRGDGRILEQVKLRGSAVAPRLQRGGGARPALRERNSAAARI